MPECVFYNFADEYVANAPDKVHEVKHKLALVLGHFCRSSVTMVTKKDVTIMSSIGRIELAAFLHMNFIIARSPKV